MAMDSGGARISRVGFVALDSLRRHGRMGA
jgi:hypothetical protein